MERSRRSSSKKPKDYLKNVTAKLNSALQSANECGHDTLIARDSSRNSRKKVYTSGPWAEVVEEIYNTDMRRRCFYDIILSRPISTPVGLQIGTSPRRAPDRGRCPAHFVIDIDFSVLAGKIESDVESLSSLLETAHRIGNRTALSEDLRNEMKDGTRAILASLVSKQSWKEAAVRLRIEVQKWVREGLGLLGFEEREQVIHALDASALFTGDEEVGRPTKMKFSLHLHLNGIVLRQHAVEGGVLARALNAVMAGSVLRCFADGTPKTDDFWIRCILLNVPDKSKWGDSGIPREVIAEMGIIDESIYGENRCMRMWLSSKIGETRPLTRVDTNGRVTEGCAVTRAEYKKGMLVFRIAHIPGLNEDGEPTCGIQLAVQKAFPALTPSCRVVLAAARPTDSPDLTNMVYVIRNLREDYLTSLWKLFHSDAIVAAPALQKNPVLIGGTTSAQYIPQSFTGTSTRCVIHSTTTIYGDSGNAVLPDEIVEHGYYHCPTCDCYPLNVPVLEGKQSGPPDMNPSAHSVVTSDFGMALYCFNCKCLHIVRQILDYGGFDGSTPNVTIVEPLQGRYFDSEAILPIFEESSREFGRPSMIAVNAGMGSGKTHAASLLASFANRVLVLTHRITLAEALAPKFESHCYKDLQPTGPLDDKDRMVICVNSLWRMKDNGNPYDLVVIDEAGFVRRHFAGETFSKISDPHIPYNRRNVISTLSKYCQSATCILLLQDGLSNEDVNFYTALRKNNLRVHKFYLPRVHRPGRYQLVEEFDDWLAELHHTVILEERKVFVACSLARDALILYIFFKKHWPNLKAAMICGDHAEPSQVKNPQDFVGEYRNYDLCIATSAMETGVSLENHYDEVFALYTAQPISHLSQIQLANRVRNSKRTVIYASKGNPFSQRQTVNLLKPDWNLPVKSRVAAGGCTGGSVEGSYPVHLDGLDDILCSALLASIVEDADVKNFNRSLWKIHQNAQVLTEFNFEKTKKQLVLKAFQSLTIGISRKNKKMLCETELNLIQQVDPNEECESASVDVLPSPAPAATDRPSPPYPVINNIEDDNLPASVLDRSTRKRLENCKDFMDNSVLEVLQAKQRISKAKKRKYVLEMERDRHGDAMTSLNFARRAFVLFAIIDHCAALKTCGGDEVKREKIKSTSYWSAIESWITDRPPTNDKQTQAEVQCVLEVFQGMHTVQAMYSTFLPEGTVADMLVTPENTIAVSNALKTWVPPVKIVACAAHTLVSSRAACDGDIREATNRDIAEASPLQTVTFKPTHRSKQGRKKRAKTLGSRTRRFVADRLPISWKITKRKTPCGNSVSAITVRPWCTSTLALVACGIHRGRIPADEAALKHCEWHFFKDMDDLYNAVFAYKRPRRRATPEQKADDKDIRNESGDDISEEMGDETGLGADEAPLTAEEEALKNVVAIERRIASKMKAASRLKFVLSREYFDKIYGSPLDANTPTSSVDSDE